MGNDTLNGGLGFDYADYRNASASVTVNLGTRTSSGADGVDTLIGIEGARGSGFNDTLIGSAADNRLDGAGGQDSLNGGGGVDYAGYNENDARIGVRASLANPSANTGDAAGDVYVSIEGLIGSRRDDVLIGNGGANILAGGRAATQ